jgi:hypothetical protein
VKYEMGATASIVEHNTIYSKREHTRASLHVGRELTRCSPFAVAAASATSSEASLCVNLFELIEWVTDHGAGSQVTSDLSRLWQTRLLGVLDKNGNASWVEVTRAVTAARAEAIRRQWRVAQIAVRAAVRFLSSARRRRQSRQNAVRRFSRDPTTLTSSALSTDASKYMLVNGGGAGYSTWNSEAASGSLHSLESSSLDDNGGFMEGLFASSHDMQGSASLESGNCYTNGSTGSFVAGQQSRSSTGCANASSAGGSGATNSSCTTLGESTWTGGCSVEGSSVDRFISDTGSLDRDGSLWSMEDERIVLPPDNQQTQGMGIPTSVVSHDHEGREGQAEDDGGNHRSYHNCHESAEEDGDDAYSDEFDSDAEIDVANYSVRGAIGRRDSSNHDKMSKGNSALEPLSGVEMRAEIGDGGSDNSSGCRKENRMGLPWHSAKWLYRAATSIASPQNGATRKVESAEGPEVLSSPLVYSLSSPSPPGIGGPGSEIKGPAGGLNRRVVSDNGSAQDRCQSEDSDDDYTPVVTPRNDYEQSDVAAASDDRDTEEPKRKEGGKEDEVVYSRPPGMRIGEAASILSSSSTGGASQRHRLERVVAEPQPHRRPSASCLRGAPNSRLGTQQQRRKMAEAVESVPERGVSFAGKVKCRLIAPIDLDLKALLFYSSEEINGFEADVAKEEARQSVHEASRRVLRHTLVSKEDELEFDFRRGNKEQEDEMYAF